MKLKGKPPIVTGAASGIGREIALVYAREGAKVAIADLNVEDAEVVRNEILAAARHGDRNGRGRRRSGKRRGLPR
jgi:3-hydroxybutyrate dehydrogenase